MLTPSKYFSCTITKQIQSLRTNEQLYTMQKKVGMFQDISVCNVIWIKKICSCNLQLNHEMMQVIGNLIKRIQSRYFTKKIAIKKFE